ncbi:hypothetical protein ACOSQ4_005349 [Xanthoceras sorbifolium]
MSDMGKDFLRKCFARNHKERWTAEMLLNHPYVLPEAAVISATTSLQVPPDGWCSQPWDSNVPPAGWCSFSSSQSFDKLDFDISLSEPEWCSVSSSSSLSSICSQLYGMVFNETTQQRWQEKAWNFEDDAYLAGALV